MSINMKTPSPAGDTPALPIEDFDSIDLLDLSVETVSVGGAHIADFGTGVVTPNACEPIGPGILACSSSCCRPHHEYPCG